MNWYELCLLSSSHLLFYFYLLCLFLNITILYSGNLLSYQGLFSETEISVYIEMYLKACQVDINNGGTVVRHSKSPKSYSDFLVKYPYSQLLIAFLTCFGHICTCLVYFSAVFDNLKICHVCTYSKGMWRPYTCQ